MAINEREIHEIASSVTKLISEGIETEVEKTIYKVAASLKIKKKIPPKQLALIEKIIDGQLSIFHNQNNNTISETRKIAQKAMKLLIKFDPMVCGKAIEDYSTENDSIDIHLFCSSIEEIITTLVNSVIPYTISERKISSGKIAEDLVIISFYAGDFRIRLHCFSENNRLRNIPCGAKESKRVSLKRFEEEYFERNKGE